MLAVLGGCRAAPPVGVPCEAQAGEPRSERLAEPFAGLLGFLAYRGWNGYRRKSWKPRADVHASSVTSCGFGRSPLDSLSLCEESLQIVCISRWEKD